MTDKRLLLLLLGLFLASSVFLAWRAERALDPDLDKDWWAVSFVEPHGPGGDFTIENHGPEASFTYRVTAEGTPVANETIVLPRGGSRNVGIAGPAPLTVDVQRGSDAQDTQAIYKKF